MKKHSQKWLPKSGIIINYIYNENIIYDYSDDSVQLWNQHTFKEENRKVRDYINLNKKIGHSELYSTKHSC